MRLALASTAYMDLPLAEAAERITELGLTTIELAVDRVAAMLDVDDLLDPDTRSSIQKILAEKDLEVTALANHGDGQLLLGPLTPITDGFFPGTPGEKQAFAIRRMQDTARGADALGVRVVSAFVGCPDYARWFHWPGERGWEAHFEELDRVMNQVLPVYREYGVRFAHELHPKQLVYDIATAARSLEVLGSYAEWGFNVDTANLALAGVDAVDFIREFPERIWYVHAKDAEVVHSRTRRHFLAHLGYHSEAQRNFRFRIAGWGDVPWRKVFTELNLAGYRGTVAVENEDTTIGRWEGCRLALDYIRPMLLQEPLSKRWW